MKSRNKIQKSLIYYAILTDSTVQFIMIKYLMQIAKFNCQTVNNFN